MSHFAKFVSSREECVYRVNGKNSEGIRCWYYVLVDRSLLKKFDEVLSDPKGALDIEAYGKILAFGAGDEPTAEEKKVIEEKYGITLVA